MKLYYSPGACSLASHIVLEETGSPYDLVRVPVQDKSNWKPEYLAVNPRGHVPALAVDEWVMTENAAIMLYLAQRFPAAGLLPSDARALAKCLEWTSWQASTGHVAFAEFWRPERFVDDADRYPIVQEGGKAQIRKRLREIEDWLSRNQYAAGAVYSIADPMFLVFYRWGWRAGETVNASTFPYWTAYVEHMSARPAIRRVLEQEGVSLHP